MNALFGRGGVAAFEADTLPTIEGKANVFSRNGRWMGADGAVCKAVVEGDSVGPEDLTDLSSLFSTTNEFFVDFTKELLMWGSECCLDGGKGERGRLRESRGRSVALTRS